MTSKYTIKEVSSILGVSHDTITRWIKLGKVKAYKLGVFTGKTSPFYISAEEVARLKKLQNARKSS